MEDTLLREIIDAEKEIQQALEREKAILCDWLEARKKEIDEDAAREEQELLNSFQQSRERAKLAVENSACGLVREAEEQAARITRLTDGALAKIVSIHIHELLPG